MSYILDLCIVTAMLASHMAWCTDQEVRCDPDIPSRPQPESGVPGVAMAQGDDQESECDEGEYFDWFKCSPCEEGTYRTKQMARENRYSRCQKCHTPDVFEIVTEPCTRTKDARIMCEDGFYRYEEPGKPCQSHCVRCDICGVGKNMFKNFEGRECSRYSNTVCCEHENMGVVDDSCVAMTTTTTTSASVTSQASTTTRAHEQETDTSIHKEGQNGLSSNNSPCAHTWKITEINLVVFLVVHVAAS